MQRHVVLEGFCSLTPGCLYAKRLYTVYLFGGCVFCHAYALSNVKWDGKGLDEVVWKDLGLIVFSPVSEQEVVGTTVRPDRACIPCLWP